MNSMPGTYSLQSAGKLVNQAGELCACPQVFSQLLEYLENPDATFEQMGTIVKADPALTTKVLKVVNSPFYSLSANITSIEHAIQVLGIQELSVLVLASCVISHFKGIPENIVTLKSFWTHSISTAVGAMILAEFLGHPHKAMLYTGGIIHDIGALILYTRLPDASVAALQRCKESGNPIHEMERQMIGFNHADVGYALALSWNLPESLQVILGHHHNMFYQGNCMKEVRIIQMAEHISQSLQLGSPGEPLPEDDAIICMTALDLQEKDLKSISNQVLNSYQEIEEIFGTR